MAGLLSGNPYYSGPSPLAAGVSAFGNDFLNTYLGVQENARKNEAMALEKQQAEATQRRLLEILALHKAQDAREAEKFGMEKDRALRENKYLDAVKNLFTPTGLLSGSGFSDAGADIILKGM